MTDEENWDYIRFLQHMHELFGRDGFAQMIPFMPWWLPSEKVVA